MDALSRSSEDTDLIGAFTKKFCMPFIDFRHKDLRSISVDTLRSLFRFHCESSSERGPKLSRFLRNHDRMSSPYPTLQYPEIYLLHGGYKEFFQNNSDLCDPHSYRPMLDTSFSNEYKHFRAKSKSWTGGGRSSNRLFKSRSRLIL